MASDMDDLDQHFLTSTAKLDVLFAAAAVAPTDAVAELGAGGGTVAARVPPCRGLTLYELDAALASRLRAALPHATVVQGDALAALRSGVRFGVLLCNLPHFLTPPLLDALSALAVETPPRFTRAVIAVRADDALGGGKHAAALAFTELCVLDEEDFTPRQPFASRLMLCTPRGA